MGYHQYLHILGDVLIGFFLGVNVIKPVSAETLYEPITASLSPNV